MSRIASIPSLKVFMMRQEVRSLYYKIVRASKKLDKDQRNSTLDFARSEFKSMKSVDDEHHIRYLLMEGRKQLDEYKALLGRTR
ncbi:hypothetical protein AAMO2058_000426500 [Amorphochlora amoebiformis]